MTETITNINVSSLPDHYYITTGLFHMTLIILETDIIDDAAVFI